MGHNPGFVLLTPIAVILVLMCVLVVDPIHSKDASTNDNFDLLSPAESRFMTLGLQLEKTVAEMKRISRKTFSRRFNATHAGLIGVIASTEEAKRQKKPSTYSTTRKPRFVPIQPTTPQQQRVFVNYAYADRVDGEKNLLFFLRNGCTSSPRTNIDVYYGLTINGECKNEICRNPEQFVVAKENFEVLRRENVGFDFGAHTAMLERIEARDGFNHTFDVYIFLNSGVIGPFVPAYLDQHNWHWTSAFSAKMGGMYSVGVVGTSIVCLSAADGGGYGPKVEGFAFALSHAALQEIRKYGTVFRQHRTKWEAIMYGEYNLSTSAMRAGYGLDCLLLAYQGWNWWDSNNWNCNDNRHPSRSRSYFGASFTPLETIFHKTAWGGRESVSVELTRIYTESLADNRK